MDVLFLFSGWGMGGGWWWRSFHLVWIRLLFFFFFSCLAEAHRVKYVIDLRFLPIHSNIFFLFPFFLNFSDWSFKFSHTYERIYSGWCVSCVFLFCIGLSLLYGLRAIFQVTQKSVVALPTDDETIKSSFLLLLFYFFIFYFLNFNLLLSSKRRGTIRLSKYMTQLYRLMHLNYYMTIQQLPGL